MKNPFREGGFITRVIPWISSVLVIFLAAKVVTDDSSGLTKSLAVAVAIAVVGRSIWEMVQQGGRRKK